MLLSKQDWLWIGRFAARLVELRPKLWLPTATAIAIFQVSEDGHLEAEEAATKYVRENPEAGDGD